jgi:uncharacterized protein (TIGR03000 family)
VTDKRLRKVIIAAALLVVVVVTRRASGQVVLDGPRWRVTIGGPVGISDKVDTGWGNYPASNGFVPGYGYYPDYSENWPTLREAIQNNPRRQRRQARGDDLPPEVNQPACAVIELLVPADAEVFFFGQQTDQRGTVRHFATPPLEPGKTYFYDIGARWRDNGQEVFRTRAVMVNAGARPSIDFRTPETPPLAVSK